MRKRNDIITTPDGENYCCWELRELAPVYGDGTLTHAPDNWDHREYDPDIWYLKFFDNAWDDVVFDHKRINFCPFCGTKIPIKTAVRSTE